MASLSRACEPVASILSFMQRLSLLAFAALGVLAVTGCAGAEEDVDDSSSEEALTQRAAAVDVAVPGFPFTEALSGASLSQRTLKAYPCGDRRAHPGPERVYQVDVVEDGLLAVEGPAGLDVYVARNMNFSDCVRGGAAQAAVWLTRGRYYVSVDARVLAPRVSASIKMGLTTARALEENGMSPDVARRGLQAFSVAYGKGDTKKLTYAMTDFGLPSNQKREWVLDLRTSEVLWNLYVAHGEKTSAPNDKNRALSFSNVSGSHQSSLGMMRSGPTYEGDFGYSYRLDGLEPGYNDKVRARTTVVHPWFGSTDRAVQMNRHVAPTWGCPAVDQNLPRSFFDAMSQGVLHWYAFDDGDWSENTRYKL